MAKFHSSKSLHLPCKYFPICLVMVYLLLVGSCTAIRTGATVRMDVSTELLRQKHQPGFPYQGLVFNFFPKGIPVPSSGPSKRHNAVVDSTPQN